MFGLILQAWHVPGKQKIIIEEINTEVLDQAQTVRNSLYCCLEAPWGWCSPQTVSSLRAETMPF